MARNLIFSDSELENLTQDDNSGIKLVKGVKHIGLHPFHLNNFYAGINETINCGIAQFDNTFDGILLCYKKPKVLPSSGAINNESCYIHLDIEAEFYVFTPEVGKIVRAVVNKTSPDHVGGLIHKTFNVSIPRPKSDEAYWLGNGVKKGQQVLIKITYTDLCYVIPYIRGEILEVFESKHLKFKVDEDSGISTSEDFQPTKKRNKHKNDPVCIENSEADEVDATDRSLNNLLKSPKMKIKNEKSPKKQKRSETINPVTEEVVRTPKTKSSNKKRKRQSSDGDVQNDDNDVNKSIKLEPLTPKRKSKTKTPEKTESTDLEQMRAALLLSAMQDTKCAILKDAVKEEKDTPKKKKSKTLVEPSYIEDTKPVKTPKKKKHILTEQASTNSLTASKEESPTAKSSHVTPKKIAKARRSSLSAYHAELLDQYLHKS